jgi:hypothetical protein
MVDLQLLNYTDTENKSFLIEVKEHKNKIFKVIKPLVLNLSKMFKEEKGFEKNISFNVKSFL